MKVFKKLLVIVFLSSTLIVSAEERELVSRPLSKYVRTDKNKDSLKLKLVLEELRDINIPKRTSCNEKQINSIPFIDVKLIKKKNIISDLRLPKKIGGEFTLFYDPNLKDVVKLGFWSKNFTTWNILKVDLHTVRNERFKTDIKIGSGSTTAEMKYVFDLGDTNKIELKAYNQFNHDMFRPKNLESGGRVGYGFKYGKLNFGFYLFAAHHQNLEK